MDHFLTTLPEIREYIFQFVPVKDLLNIACCSKVWYEIITFHIYKDVELDLVDFSKLESFDNFKYTTSLVLTGCADDSDWSDHDLKLKLLIDNCQESMLKSFTLFDSNLPMKWAKLILEKFMQLENISFVCYYNLDVNYLHKLSLLFDPSLRELQLEFESCTYDVLTIGFKSIEKLSHLHELNLSTTMITDKTLIDICNNVLQLKTLTLHNCCLSDEGFANINRLEHLMKLDVSKNRITDTGCSFLSKIISLWKLELQDNPSITDVGIKHISKLKNITYLDIGNTLTTDLGLTYISDFTLLTNLSLRNCDITEFGVKTLDVLHLKYLNVNNSMSVM